MSYPPAIAWRGSSIQLNATFTLSGGQSRELTVPGFWDGDRDWKVRMALPKAGDWHWRTTCSNASDIGLHNKSGYVTVTDYRGSNPLFKHGFLRPHSSGRFLEHMDGTPFYWLGDTHWSGFSTAEHWANSDNTTVDPEIVDVRAAQGYSVWKGETFVVNGKQGGSAGSIANAGGQAWGEGGMYGDLRPEFWQAIDDIMAYINSKGIVVSHAFAGIGRGLKQQSMVAPILDLARYNVARYGLAAFLCSCAMMFTITHHVDCPHGPTAIGALFFYRYSAFSTVWTTCQEYCAGDEPWATTAWGKIASSQFDLDPHKRSTSLHNCASNPIPAWRGEAWYGHNTNQQGACRALHYAQLRALTDPTARDVCTGHFITSGVEHWLSQYNAEPPKVLIEDEANYELLKYATMTTNVPGWLTRQSAWQSQIAGAAGYTYGGQGIWWACYDRSYVNGNCGPNDKPGTPMNESGYYTWDQCLNFPVGGHQLPLMAQFFRRLPWYTLQPSATAVVWDSSAPNNTQKPYAKADVAGDYIVAYLPQANGNPHTPEGPPGTPAIGCRPPPGTLNHSAAGMYGGTAKVNIELAHTASWFNPRTGEETLIAQLPKGLATWEVPRSRPGGDHEAWRDWVLLIHPRTVLQHVRDANGGIDSSFAETQGDADVSWVTNVSAKGRIRPAPVENGCSFVATQTMTVKQLCRYALPGDNNVETVAIFRASNGTIDSGSVTAAAVPVATANVDALSRQRDEHGFICAAVNVETGSSQISPPVLAQGEKYFLTQNLKCDAWRDDTGTTIEVVGGDAAKVASFYGTPPNVISGGGGANHCYGPLNFHFTTTSTSEGV